MFQKTGNTLARPGRIVFDAQVGAGGSLTRQTIGSDTRARWVAHTALLPPAFLARLGLESRHRVLDRMLTSGRRYRHQLLQGGMQCNIWSKALVAPCHHHPSKR